MSGNEQPGKIGIGPEGRMGGLIQVVFFVIVAFICVYAIPPDLIVLTLMPASLFMLIALAHVGILGDGFPLAPPGGSWNPTVSRLIPGLGMTAIWILLTAAILSFMLNVFPKWPMSPLYLWFGLIGFWMTLLYGINWNCWPFKGKLHPWATMCIGFAIVMAVSILVWNFTNLGGTPFENSPFDQKGPININWLTGYLMWAIVWFSIFNPIFTTQGTPFQKLGHPGGAIAQTIVAHILALVTWNGTLAMGMSPTFSFAALCAPLIFWSYVHSWHLQFLGVSKFTGMQRAIMAFLVECVLVAVWIVVLNIGLGPLAAEVAAKKLPADINLLMIFHSLCIALPLLIAHNAFWLRWPLTLPMPPGTPPPDQAD